MLGINHLHNNIGLQQREMQQIFSQLVSYYFLVESNECLQFNVKNCIQSGWSIDVLFSYFLIGSSTETYHKLYKQW